MLAQDVFCPVPYYTADMLIIEVYWLLTTFNYRPINDYA